ncbi:putative phloem protein [Helianthus annuus]|nr:putative phloem protein [Helianthus annuus]
MRIYHTFSKGILLQNDNVLFSLGSNGERNEMISARMFLYKNHTSYKCRSLQESRFSKVVEVFDTSKLKIPIKITTQFLSPGVKYGAYIIFKFRDTRKASSKQIYVNLKYKMGGETLHAYFATWRNDKWMKIELCRFLRDKKDTDFEVLLESFSKYHCGTESIYVEGIEFRDVSFHSTILHLLKC